MTPSALGWASLGLPVTCFPHSPWPFLMLLSPSTGTESNYLKIMKTVSNLYTGGLLAQSLAGAPSLILQTLTLFSILHLVCYIQPAPCAQTLHFQFHSCPYSPCWSGRRRPLGSSCGAGHSRFVAAAGILLSNPTALCLSNNCGVIIHPKDV
jgi:hypothetical protein